MNKLVTPACCDHSMHIYICQVTIKILEVMMCNVQKNNRCYTAFIDVALLLVNKTLRKLLYKLIHSFIPTSTAIDHIILTIHCFLVSWFSIIVIIYYL